MFGLFRTQNAWAKQYGEDLPRNLYRLCFEQSRQEEFYLSYGVPDNFNGRFDLLLIHMFLIFDRLITEQTDEAKNLSQALFDVTFANMDQSLREMGIGDMGVPKHMRKMMKAYNGRMHSYQKALDENNAEELKQALERNLYATTDSVSDEALTKMANYMLGAREALKKQPYSDIQKGNIQFKSP